MTKYSNRNFVENTFFWAGIVCMGWAWTCWSGVYVSTYRLFTYESWFAYALASAGIGAMIFSLRKIELEIPSTYFWVTVPLVFYGLFIPHPYSLRAFWGVDCRRGPDISGFSG
jgi:FtsH-binding integral membrane protein